MNNLITLPSVLVFMYVLVAVVLHEIGHYFWAKRENNYKGWGILPTPHIKLNKPFRSNWGYAMGFIWSLPALLIFWGDNYYLFMGFMGLVALAILDFFIILLPKKYYLEENKQK